MKGNRSIFATVLIALFILLPPALYVGTYYALADRWMLHHWVFVSYQIPGIQIPGVYLDRFFAPMHWLDRKLRPVYWGLDYVDLEEEFRFAPSGQ